MFIEGGEGCVTFSGCDAIADARLPTADDTRLRFLYYLWLGRTGQTILAAKGVAAVWTGQAQTPGVRNRQAGTTRCVRALVAVVRVLNIEQPLAALFLSLWRWNSPRTAHTIPSPAPSLSPPVACGVVGRPCARARSMRGTPFHLGMVEPCTTTTCRLERSMLRHWRYAANAGIFVTRTHTFCAGARLYARAHYH